MSASIWRIYSGVSGPNSIAPAFSSTCLTVRKPGWGRTAVRPYSYPLEVRPICQSEYYYVRCPQPRLPPQSRLYLARAGLEWDPASERFSEGKRCISTFRRCASNRRDARRWNGAANQDLIHKKDIEQAPQVVSSFECIQIVDLRVPAVVARGKQIAIWLNLEQARNPCSRHRELPRPCCIIEGNPKSRPSPNCDSTSTFSPCKPSNIRT